MGFSAAQTSRRPFKIDASRAVIRRPSRSCVLTIPGLRDRDHRRSQYPVVEQIALLEDLHHGVAGSLLSTIAIAWCLFDRISGRQRRSRRCALAKAALSCFSVSSTRRSASATHALPRASPRGRPDRQQVACEALERVFVRLGDIRRRLFANVVEVRPRRRKASFSSQPRPRPSAAAPQCQGPGRPERSRGLGAGLVDRDRRAIPRDRRSGRRIGFVLLASTSVSTLSTGSLGPATHLGTPRGFQSKWGRAYPVRHRPKTTDPIPFRCLSLASSSIRGPSCRVAARASPRDSPRADRPAPQSMPGAR